VSALTAKIAIPQHFAVFAYYVIARLVVKTVYSVAHRAKRRYAGIE
jgi:hypothetical protein